MLRFPILRSVWLLMPAAVFAGCGSSDSGPPPEATAPYDGGELAPPDVSLGSPTDTQGSPSSSGQGAGTPAAPKGDQ